MFDDRFFRGDFLKIRSQSSIVTRLTKKKKDRPQEFDQIMEYLGKRGKDYYLPHGFGHEAVGKVESVGKRVKKVKIGDKVILSWIKGDGLDFGGFTLNNIRNEKINFGPLSAFSSHVIACENRVFLKPAKMNFLEAVLYCCAVPTGAGMVLNQLKEIKKNNI